MTPSLATLGQFEVDHRRIHGTPPPADVVNRVVLGAFRSFRERGAESGIDPYLLMTHIADALHRRRDPAFFGAPLRWYARTLQHWATLARTGTLSSLPLRDRTEITRLLRREDLYPFLSNQEKYQSSLRRNTLQ